MGVLELQGYLASIWIHFSFEGIIQGLGGLLPFKVSGLKAPTCYQFLSQANPLYSGSPTSGQCDWSPGLVGPWADTELKSYA